jgi:hypothetical protein
MILRLKGLVKNDNVRICENVRHYHSYSRVKEILISEVLDY